MANVFAQAEALAKLLASKGSEISLVLALQVGQEELVTRLLNRGKTFSRSDDREINILCDAMRDPLKLAIQAVHIELEFVCFFPYMN